MSDDDKPELRPATTGELQESLSFALRYEGRKRVHHADDVMARITAERLVIPTAETSDSDGAGIPTIALI